jgi:hypothetical protein
MSSRRLLLVGLGYLVFDLADPVLPGAFSFEVRDSEIEEAVHVRRRPEDRQAVTAQPAPPERRVEPCEDSPTRPHLAVRAEPTGGASPRHPAPRSALPVTAPSPDDH